MKIINETCQRKPSITALDGITLPIIPLTGTCLQEARAYYPVQDWLKPILLDLPANGSLQYRSLELWLGDV